jgi:hypothetical protein
VRLVAAVQQADYRADLGQLRVLAAQIEPFTRDSALACAAHSWRGFAYWRRALNGANQPDADPAVIEQDFADAAAEFRRALALDSTDLEAQIGAGATLMSLGWFRRRDPVQAADLWREAQRLLDKAERRDPENPRLRFVSAGQVYWTPAEFGGDQERAIEMVNQGLERVRGTRPPADPLVPGWGEAELHMLAAFFHSDRATPDLVRAEHHARAALAFHPDWQYVRDILLPQITRRSR